MLPLLRRFGATLFCATAGLALFVPPTHAGERQGTMARMDIYIPESAFNLGQTKGSHGTRVSSCNWLGKGKERTGVSCEKALGKDWQEIWVEFVPEKSGEVDIDLQGEWYEKASDNDIRLVWADRVTVEGASIRNGDFEEADENGQPSGWRFTGPLPLERYSRDGAVAKSGRCCVAIWWGAQARQKFPVEQGKTYRVRAWFRVLDPGLVREKGRVMMESPMETYAQEATIVFRSEEAAAKASVVLAPLYDGCAWSMSCRWDDNNADDLKMRDVLAKHGHKATWYLNAVERNHFKETGKALLAGGNSIGGHSLTHPMLTYLSRHRIFEEVAGVRMEWEAAVDMPVITYSFSFCDCRNDMEGDAVHADIARLLERAGFYHTTEPGFYSGLRTDILHSPIMPWDGAEIDDFAQSALSDEEFHIDHPNLSYAMHVWYRTPEAWAKFEDQLDKYGHNPDWWYCNQNEYAAYRWQFLRTKLSPPAREGNALRLRIERPVLLDLNDPTPLTFQVGGVPRNDVVEAKCATAECAPSERQAGVFHFHLFHDRNRALPKKIGLVSNPDNRVALAETDQDADFPGLKALLRFQDGEMRVLLDNQGKEPLRGVRLAYRLPLAWKEGVVRRAIEDVPAGSRREEALKPTRATEEYKYNSGPAFFAVQIDFMLGAEPGRLHVACRAKSPARDPSYPQGGFARLGPIPEKEMDLEKLRADLQAGKPLPGPRTLSDGTRLDWVTEDDSSQPPFLDPEVIRITGNFDNRTASFYLLQGMVNSPREQEARLCRCVSTVPRVFLNGTEVKGDAIILRQGDNLLLLVYQTLYREGQKFSQFSRENAGCFLRLMKPGAEERLADVRFEPAKPN